MVNDRAAGEKRSYDVVKRMIDVVVSVIALIVLSPVLCLVAVLVAVKLGRPVIFRQERPGKDERVFTLYKFRSMHDVDTERGLVSNEQRLTGFGRRLRATSLDELPSLWNILRGDMSLVGPRPLLVEYLPRYSEQQARRHVVRPGLTGLAQVSGRNSLDWNSRFLFDIAYIERRSLGLDFRILARTALKVLARDGISSAGHAVGAPFKETSGDGDSER